MQLFHRSISILLILTFLFTNNVYGLRPALQSSTTFEEAVETANEVEERAREAGETEIDDEIVYIRTRIEYMQKELQVIEGNQEYYKDQFVAFRGTPKEDHYRTMFSEANDEAAKLRGSIMGLNSEIENLRQKRAEMELGQAPPIDPYGLISRERTKRGSAQKRRSTEDGRVKPGDEEALTEAELVEKRASIASSSTYYTSKSGFLGERMAQKPVQRDKGEDLFSTAIGRIGEIRTFVASTDLNRVDIYVASKFKELVRDNKLAELRNSIEDLQMGNDAKSRAVEILNGIGNIITKTPLNSIKITITDKFKDVVRSELDKLENIIEEGRASASRKAPHSFLGPAKIGMTGQLRHAASSI